MAPGAEGNGGGSMIWALLPLQVLAFPLLCKNVSHISVPHPSYVTETDGYPEELCVSVHMLQ